MAYKTILLCLNEIERVPQLLAAARKTATEQGAHVTGLYVVPAVQVYASAGIAAVPDVYDGNQKFYLNHLPKVEAAFSDAMKSDGLPFSFQRIDASTPLMSSAVIAESRNADLVIASATNPDDVMGAEYDFIQRLVIGAGRPVLVLPRKGEVPLDFSEILVGWDGGREAARAAFDAIPFLQKAKHVKIVRVDEAPRGSLGAASIAEALSRHKIKVELLNVTSDGMNAGEALLRAANDHGCKLVVMGAYGHSRFSEFVFGGATRHAIHNLDRPILMSH